MKRILKWLLVLVVIAAGVVFVVGNRLPEEHSVTREREYGVAPERVFSEIATPGAYPKWRSGVQRVEVRPADSSGVVHFTEYGLGDETVYAIEQRLPPRLFVTRIVGDDLPYGGTWTFEVLPTAGGSLVRITEDGEVYNPIFRFVSRYVMGQASSIEKFLQDLDARLTQPAVP